MFGGSRLHATVGAKVVDSLVLCFLLDVVKAAFGLIHGLLSGRVPQKVDTAARPIIVKIVLNQWIFAVCVRLARQIALLLGQTGGYNDSSSSFTLAINLVVHA